MRLAGKFWKAFRILGGTLLLFPCATLAQHYTQTPLVSDTIAEGANPPDNQLVNPWGLTRSATSPWWIADNGTGLATLYNGTGGKITAIEVTIPPPKGITVTAAPDGIVLNGSPTDFLLPVADFPATFTGSRAAGFIFVTEDGTISGWSGSLSNRSEAVLLVDNSMTKPLGAVYKGATIAQWNGKHYLYVTNFRSGRVEVYDTNFNRVSLREELFDDDFIPRGFAPFNVQAIGGNVYVTYAKQDSVKHDNVAGAGNGFVEIYNAAGFRLGRLEHGPWLDSPWAVTMATRDFGAFSSDLLVGNFGSGQIAAFNPVTGQFLGLMQNPDNSILTIEGLWGLSFGNGGTAGPEDTLYFTAGPDMEMHGLFGTLVPIATELSADQE